MSRLIIDRKYAELLGTVGISSEEVLKKAELPNDLFSHKTPTITDKEYYRFMKAIDELSLADDLPLKLATAENIVAFYPPVFAAYCSKNGLTCIQRLAQYKALIGTVVFDVKEVGETISVEIASENHSLELPEILVGTEFIFLVHLIRSATKKDIIPVQVMVKQKMKNSVYAEFLKTNFKVGSKNIISFSRHDMMIPFITRNDSMWEYFEPELKKRLSEVAIDTSVSSRVRSALMEALAGGESSIEYIAHKLGLSRRTLQRKLKEENTTFQQQLNHTRELLAKHYLKNTDLSSEDIAYLLGYQDINSFFRAFALWTGVNVSEYKKVKNRVSEHNKNSCTSAVVIKTI
nr:helix-turn-helix domain-containing protein [uncultured Cellulosilyticum sp.]